MLCQTCQSLFCGYLGEKAELTLSWKVHHLSASSFYNAVQQNCYICQSLWRQLNERQRDSLQLKDTDETATCYNLYKSSTFDDFKLGSHKPDALHGRIKFTQDLSPSSGPAAYFKLLPVKRQSLKYRPISRSQLIYFDRIQQSH